MKTLPVMFRMDKSGEHREVTAVFPTEPASRNPGSISIYAHNGQHGEGTRDWMTSRTRPATPAEYASLLHELRGIYEHGPDAVKLRIVKRSPPPRHW